jgi:putative hydrolase of the HAD superfamily
MIRHKYFIAHISDKEARFYTPIYKHNFYISSMKNIQIVAFDADDTLWVNEPNYQEVEQKFCQLLEDFLSHHHISQELFKTEMANLELYGYGAKSFMLSMIETAMRISDHTLNAMTIQRIMDLGKELINRPIQLLEGVDEVLKSLHGKYLLVVATKGDLLDQERKLRNSGLEKYFHHIEIMSDKKEQDYSKLLRQLNVVPENFLMIGNSLKSDIIPVINIGGWAIHVPYHTTWAHEHIEFELNNPRFFHLPVIADTISLLKY